MKILCLHISKYIKSAKNDSGQALLLVIVSLTVALAVVTSISVRNLSSISRITQTDTSYRVSAAAEGGAERFLNLSTSQLASVATDANVTSCTNAGAGYDSAQDRCTVTFAPISPDTVSSTAYVSVTNYPSGTSFETSVKKDETYELNLSTYAGTGVDVYWRATSGSLQPSVFILGYTGTMTSTLAWKQLYCPNSGCSASLVDNSSGTLNGSISTGTFVNGVSNVSTRISGNNMYGLRILVLGADADIRIEGRGGSTIPQQGYLIESIGELSGSSNVSATKTVSVFRSYPFLPSMYSFGIYNGGNALP